MQQQPVLFDERQAPGGKRIGFATLNAERTLNSLNQPMIDLLRIQLHAWALDPAIACVVLAGSGEKAFCAGGDIVSLYRSIQQYGSGPNPVAERFFETEYRLDYLIHTYPKPLLCWGHGIVMGGGVGLMVGASHRVVTERSRIAMPEITIGLYPDVAGTWFLNRMPGRSGLYLGLTGCSINAADALYAGLADYLVSAEQREAVFAALAAEDWSDDADRNRGLLSALLRDFAEQSRAQRPASPLEAHRERIDRATDQCSVEEIIAALRVEAEQAPWLAEGLETLRRGSPTSAKVILQQYRRGKHLSLRETFVRELGMSVQFMRRADFAEGVRALLVDKDRNPRWQPATLAEVSDELVQAHFQPPAGFDSSPLDDLWRIDGKDVHPAGREAHVADHRRAPASA